MIIGGTRMPVCALWLGTGRRPWRAFSTSSALNTTFTAQG